MKKKLTALLLALTTAVAFGHGDVEIGPNGGRILEFSKNETMHGEVTVKDGKFNIALLDKDMKPVAVAAQTLTATGGTPKKPAKLEVTKTETGFSEPVAEPPVRRHVPSRWQVSRLADVRALAPSAFPPSRQMPVAWKDLSGHGRGGGCASASRPDGSQSRSHSLFACPKTGTSAASPEA